MATLVEGEMRSHLTGRGCAEPRELCRGCLVTGISPGGRLGLVERLQGERWPLDDQIGTIDLTAPGAAVEWLDLQGGLATFVDETSFVYLARNTPEACIMGGGGEGDVSDLRRHWLPDGRDELLAAELRRAWMTCCPTASPDGRFVAAETGSPAPCGEEAWWVSLLDVGAGRWRYAPWAVDDEPDFVFGLLPDGSGFLVQTVHFVAESLWESKVYAVEWTGHGELLVSGLDGHHHLDPEFREATGYFWPGCVAVRRLGPSCEYYCKGHAGAWWRRRIGDAEPEAVDCPGFERPFRIVDVWQAPSR